MNMLRSTLLLAGMFAGLTVFSQRSPNNPDGPDINRFGFSLALGTANYNGDLVKQYNFYAQNGLSVGAGASYTFSEKLAARFNIGYQRLQGADGKNQGAHPGRNLSFKSNVVDLALSAEYTLLSLQNFRLSPYLHAGVGVMFFNPYTIDANGSKQSLRILNTEGQGLPGYNKPYNTTAMVFPLGGGIKYPLSENLACALDISYRVTRTDYLDDVSMNKYPDKALLDARNPLTARFTWRGNEVGSGPYPKNAALPRGNPNNQDGYLTTQLKFIFTW